MRRLVLFVEGRGDVNAAPTLVKRLLSEKGEWNDVLLDDQPFQVKSLGNLVKSDFREWKRLLGASIRTRRDVGGVLLILDGDIEGPGGNEFCAAATARKLAGAAIPVGAGKGFSVAVVFARQEYETWLIAGVSSLAGRRLPHGRLIDPVARPPEGDLEEGPRDAKGWLSDVVGGGYSPPRDQAALTSLVDLGTIRARELRSFRRLESALSGLLAAFRNGEHIVSPL